MPRNQKDLAVLVIAIGLLVAGIVFWIRSSSPTRPITLKMTAGDGSGLRHRLATEFAMEASKSGIQMDITATEGSEAALEKLGKGEFDIALVQLTRLILHQRENIEQLAATQNHTVDEVWLEQSKLPPSNPPINALHNQNSL